MWDLSTTTNWTLANGTLDRFYNLDSVTFDDTVFPKNGTVNVSTTVNPSGVVVNNSAFPYAFNGAGKITGPTSLIKNGTSTLSISQTGTNDYTGGTVINAGTIDTTTRASSAIGTGTVTFAGGALTSNALTTAVTFTNPLLFSNATSSSLTVNGTGAATFNGALSGNGSVTIASDTAGRAIDFNGSASTFGGQMTVQGVLNVRLSSVSFSGAATYNLPAGGTLSTSGGTTSLVTTLTIGALNGSSTSTLKGYNGGGAGTGGAIAYQIGDANKTAVFAGNVIDGITGTTARTVSIIKSGTGIQTLSGSNSYTGITQVNSGTLVLGGVNAWTPALTGTSVSTTGGTVLTGGRLVFDYTSAPASNPATIIGSDLKTGSAGNFLAGPIRTTTAADGKHGIGWLDNGSTTM